MTKNPIENLAYITSPLQVIMAYEATLHYGLSQESTHFVLVDVNGLTRKAFLLTIDFLKWTNFSYFSDKTLAQHTYSNRNERKATLKNLLFSGKGRPPINVQHSTRTIHFTDGIEVLSRVSQYIAPHHFLHFKRQKIAELFTPYPTNSCPQANIQYNQFTGFRSLVSKQINKAQITETVLFVGAYLTETPFSDTPISKLSQDEYVNFILKLADYYRAKGLSFEYAPHHFEGENKLLELEMRGVTIYENQGGIEITLLKSARLPRVIAGFHSSALYHICKMFPDIKPISYQLNPNIINYKYREIFDTSFSFYRNLIESINFEEI